MARYQKQKEPNVVIDGIPMHMQAVRRNKDGWYYYATYKDEQGQWRKIYIGPRDTTRTRKEA